MLTARISPPFGAGSVVTRLEGALARGQLDPQQKKSGGAPSGEQPDLQRKKEVEELKRRDAEVRQHEQAHQGAAGRYTQGGPQFDYVTGPDGKRYAVGGEVSIDTSKVPNDPQATIQKAQTIKRAALAPANPSSQDRSVAAKANQMETEARRELAKKQTEEAQGYNKNGHIVPPEPEPTSLDRFI